MNTPIALMIVMIAGNVCFVLDSFSKKRVRAPWAKLIYLVTGIIGIIVGGIHIALDAHWLAFSTNTTYGVNIFLQNLGGIWIGFIVSLFVSRQIEGTKIAAGKNNPSLRND
jgi:hypothetical protein